MKNTIKLIVLCMVVTLLAVGCAKEPTQEITDATNAIQAAVDAGANTYAAEQMKALNDELTAATTEGKELAGKMFKSTDAVKEKLAKIKADAEALKESIPTLKEEAKNKAVAAQTEAKTAIDEAKAQMDAAPKVKTPPAEFETIKADLTSLDESYAEVQKLIDSEDFVGASEKCTAIKEKAVASLEQLKQVIATLPAPKGKK